MGVEVAQEVGVWKEGVEGILRHGPEARKYAVPEDNSAEFKVKVGQEVDKWGLYRAYTRWLKMEPSPDLEVLRWIREYVVVDVPKEARGLRL